MAVEVISAALAYRRAESATYIYVGEAAPGTQASAAAWRISRLTVADRRLEWADGDGEFDNVWDDRASLSYS